MRKKRKKKQRKSKKIRFKETQISSFNFSTLIIDLKLNLIRFEINSEESANKKSQEVSQWRNEERGIKL